MTRTDILGGIALGLALFLGAVGLEITTGTEAPPTTAAPVIPSGDLAPGFGE